MRDDRGWHWSFETKIAFSYGADADDKVSLTWKPGNVASSALPNALIPCVYLVFLIFHNFFI